MATPADKSSNKRKDPSNHAIQINKKATTDNIVDDDMIVEPSTPGLSDSFSNTGLADNDNSSDGTNNAEDETSDGKEEGQVFDIPADVSDGSFITDDIVIWTMTIADIATGITFDSIIPVFHSILSFLPERSFMNKPSKRLYIAFGTFDDYEVASRKKYNFGTVVQSSNYDPTDVQGIYWRALFSSCDIGSLNQDLIKSAFESKNVGVSSCTINAVKGFTTIYFKDKKSWRKALSSNLIEIKFEKSGGKVILRTVVTLATTSDVSWHKLFISNLPGNITERALRLTIRNNAFCTPEIVALVRGAKDHKIHNYGYLFTKNPVIKDRLLQIKLKNRGKEVSITYARAYTPNNNK